jgi:CubicO group peptidase (beta-lactamase class C family)
MNITPYVKAIEERNLKVEGIIVLKKGERVAEHRWVPEGPRQIFSVSKSFTAMAVGLALAEGKLSLKDRVIDSFSGLIPQCADPSPRLASLTLEHLLTMSRGHARFSRPRTVQDALAQTLDYEPGTRFIYDNGSTFLASAMVTRSLASGADAGPTVRDYLLDRLFRPLGIEGPVWEESPDGYTMGATGLELTTGDLAVFGQFLLQRGCWKGRQLVPAPWIDGATRTHVATGKMGKPNYGLGYGYCFWTCPYGAYRADGKNGQFVVVFPREEAVVAITSDEPDMEPILDAVWDHILPL